MCNGHQHFFFLFEDSPLPESPQQQRCRCFDMMLFRCLFHSRIPFSQSSFQIIWLRRNTISNLPHHRLFETLFDIVNSAILSAPSVIGPFHHFNLHYRCHPSKGYQVQETDYISPQNDVHALLLGFTYLTLYSDPCSLTLSLSACHALYRLLPRHLASFCSAIS